MESRKSGPRRSSAVRMRREAGGEFDGFAVRRVAIGFRPGLFARGSAAGSVKPFAAARRSSAASQ